MAEKVSTGCLAKVTELAKNSTAIRADLSQTYKNIQEGKKIKAERGVLQGLQKLAPKAEKSIGSSGKCATTHNQRESQFHRVNNYQYIHQRRRRSDCRTSNILHQRCPRDNKIPSLAQWNSISASNKSPRPRCLPNYTRSVVDSVLSKTN